MHNLDPLIQPSSITILIDQKANITILAMWIKEHREYFQLHPPILNNTTSLLQNTPTTIPTHITINRFNKLILPLKDKLLWDSHLLS